MISVDQALEIREDCKGASKDNPISIKVIIGESPAGIPFKGRLRGGSAIRISTGAILRCSSQIEDKL